MFLEANTACRQTGYDEAAQRASARSVQSRRPCRVLVVDDDELIRACLDALLKREGYEVELAASGADALRSMRASLCDILVTDWQMPDMDGLELCRNVREEFGDDSVYVAVLTVREAPEDRSAGIAAGADDFLVKGGPLADILARLEAGRHRVHAARPFRAANPENRRASLTDASTNVPNRRFFEAEMPQEIERARRGRQSLALLDCRIVDFEKMNGAFGYDVGADALRAFVVAAESCLRKRSGWLARVDVDQVILVLPAMRLMMAERIARKLHQTFESVPVASVFGPASFSVSIVVTALEPRAGDGLSSSMDLIRRNENTRLH
jgi:diguanylate cyclase (GGDEF)-like protein